MAKVQEQFNIVVKDVRVAGWIGDDFLPGMKRITVNQYWTFQEVIDAIKLAIRQNGNVPAGLYFFSHGHSASAQVGEGISWNNVAMFEQLKGLVTVIVFYGCCIALELESENGKLFCRQVAMYADATVVASIDSQMVCRSGVNKLDYGEWEGTVCRFHPPGKGLDHCLRKINNN